jgi:uncharacterized protein involved in type VI secretion and phage assembly
MSSLDQQTLELLERMRNRFYGKYRGTVKAIDTNTLRIKAIVPAVLGQTPTGWCQPCVPYAGKNVGFLFLPEEGDFVWIEFEGGDPSYPIWAGCGWRVGELPQDATPKVKVIVTSAQHKLLLDDDGATITISDQNENSVALDSNGVTVERSGKKLVVSDSEVNVGDGAFQVS